MSKRDHMCLIVALETLLLSQSIRLSRRRKVWKNLVRSVSNGKCDLFMAVQYGCFILGRALF